MIYIIRYKLTRRKHWEKIQEIKENADIIEKRIDDSYLSMDGMIEENAHYLQGVQENNLEYILIDDKYQFDFSL